MSSDLEPMVSDSNWIFCYVVISAIPLVFLLVALFSVWQDRRSRARHDVEAIKDTYAKYWSPSHDTVPEWMRSQQAGGRSAQRPKTYVATLPMNRVGPRSAQGFPVSAASQLPTFGARSPRSERLPAPAWTGGNSSPSNYAGMHSMDI